MGKSVHNFFDLFPLFRFCRAENSICNQFHSVAVAERGGGLGVGGDGAEEVVTLDDLRFRIANAESGNGPQTFAVGVIGACIYGAETAAVIAVLGETYLQLVSALVIEEQRTFGSMDFKGTVVVLKKEIVLLSKIVYFLNFICPL